ncbi:MAG TPA: ABC transporter ATP-binding protein [Anaeromyxobacteraceae bacterium]|nr:ABC transporter ATP-binding protein [Anaeromyxobacteraceae bacterium]
MTTTRTNGAAGPIIELEDVSKVFVTEEVETHALSGVHLRVDAGEWVAVVGPSGSGKSTLLAILGLLEAPTSGAYRLSGERAEALDPRARARLRNERIGFVFQSFNLIGDVTVVENVELPLAYRGVGPKARRQRAEAALELVGMTHRARHHPAQLSGGQQQRVAVARAIAGDPVLVLADEPTGNLDSQNGQNVMRLLQELHAAGSTIVMVTHDAAQARAATRTVTLFDGKVVQDEPARRPA